MIKPQLQKNVPAELAEIPEATAFAAGYLVTKNAGWRGKRPVVSDSSCVGCLQCWLYCPDGTIVREGRKVRIDYDFCKGCGICEKMCRFHAVQMVPERSEQTA